MTSLPATRFPSGVCTDVRVLIDGLPITGSSLAIVVEHLLEGWRQDAPQDELHLVVGPHAELAVADDITVHAMPFGRIGGLSRVRHQTFTIPRLARSLDADVVVGVLPTTSQSPLPCPRVVIAYDLRHELRPEQFSRANRIQRRFSYRWKQADAIACISDRTRQDLLRSRPWLADRPVEVTHLGGDHVDDWPAPDANDDYALAFGQYGNKNVDLVIDAWKLLADRGQARTLRIVGLGGPVREVVEERLESLGLTDLVTAMPWLSEEEFRTVFTGANLIVFPSDFEGFGLPAVEAMRRGTPVAITPEAALLEVTDGHAEVMDGWDAQALADAVERVADWDDDRIVTARQHAEQFTWARTARQLRELITRVVPPQ